MTSPEVPPSLLPQDPQPAPAVPQPAPIAPQIAPPASSEPLAQTLQEQGRAAFREYLRRSNAEEEDTLRTVLNSAARVNPDVEAERQRLAAQLGVPEDQLPIDLEAVRAAAKTRQLDELRASLTDPGLRARLLDVKTSRLVHDDVEGIKQLAGLTGWLRRTWEAGTGVNDLGDLYARKALARANKTSLPDRDLDRIAELEQIQLLAEHDSGVLDEGMKLFAQMAKPALTAAGVGLTTAGMASLGGPISAGTAGTWGAAAAMFAHSATVEFGHQYQDIYTQLRGAGVPEDEAHETAMGLAGAYAFSAALVDTVSLGPTGKAAVGATKAVAGRLLGIAGPTMTRAGMQWLKSTAGSIASEAVGEGTQDILGAIAQNVAGQLRGVDTGPTAWQALVTAGQTMWKTAKGMAVLGPIAPTIHYVADLKKVEQAKKAGAFFDGLAKAATDSKLAERSPQRFAQLVQAQVDEATATVYIEAPKLEAALQQAGVTREQFAEILPDAAKQLADGVDDVAIPTGDFAAKIARSDLYPLVKNSARFGAQGFSLDRAEEWVAEQKANAEVTAKKVEEAAAKVSDWNKQAVDVEVRIADEIRKDPRYSEAQVKYYAFLHRAHVEAMAAHAGVTPAQWDAENKLTIEVPPIDMPAQEGVLSQDRPLRTDTPEFKTWFGGSKIVDEKGAPLVVYHGTATPGFERFRKAANGLWFAYDAANAEGGSGAPAAGVYPVYVRAENPLTLAGADLTAFRESQHPKADMSRLVARARSEGYDALVVPGYAVVAFDGTQVKSVNNRGTWDNSGNMLRQNEPPAEPMIVAHQITAENLVKAEKLGGLPVPSLGITKADKSYTGFGDIVLIGPLSMADPASTPVFDADAYTARFPEVFNLPAPQHKVDHFEATFRMAFRHTGESLTRVTQFFTAGPVGARASERDALNALRDSNGAVAAFLVEQGVLGSYDELPMVTPRPYYPIATDPELQAAFKAEGFLSRARAGWTWDTLQKARELAQAAIDRMYPVDSQPWRKFAYELGTAGSALSEANRGEFVSSLDQLRQDLFAVSVGPRVSGDALQRLLLQYQLTPQFSKWTAEKIGPLFEAGPQILDKKGDPVPATLENIVAAMTFGNPVGTEMPGVDPIESLGLARALATKRYRSIDEIKADRARVVDAEVHKKANKEAALRIERLKAQAADIPMEVGAYLSPGSAVVKALIELTKVMQEAPPATPSTSGIEPPGWLRFRKDAHEALESVGFVRGRDPDDSRSEDMSDEFDMLADELAEQAEKFREHPVDYLEAKPPRAVQLNEFRGAAVPTNTPKSALDVLERAGIVVARYTAYNKDAQRMAVEAVARDLDAKAPGTILFQNNRGEFDPTANRIFLNPKADATTLLHELSHFWLTSLFRAASTPNATPAITKLAQTVLDWFGVKDIAAWDALGLEGQRKHHEAWAYHAELSFFGVGKAPTNDEDARRAFRAFGRYVRSVYKKTRDVLNETYRREFGTDLPSLTDDVRAVFDRMVASEDAITAAHAERAMDPLLTEKPADMTDAQWQELQQAARDTEEKATEELEHMTLRAMKWVGTNMSRVARMLQRETRKLRAKVEAEERAKVEAEPVYRAAQILRHGQNGSAPFKLSIPEFKARGWFGDYTAEEAIAKLGTGPSGMLATDGIPLDLAAQTLGFDTGEALVRELLAAPPIKDVVARRADERMLREHSDLMDPAKVQRTIEKAVHNDARMKLVAAELRWLSKTTSPLPLMVRAAKAHAQETIGDTPVGKVKAHEHARAETQARRDAMRALANGDHERARSHKRRELLEAQLEREALRVQDEVENARALVAKLFRSDKKLAPTRDVDYVAVARYLAAAFGLTGRKAEPETYIDQLKQYNPALFERLNPILERARGWASAALAEGRVVESWRDLTVDEFRDLHSAIDSLWTLSSREAKFRTEKRLADLEDIAGEVVPQLEATNTKKPEPVEAPVTLFKKLTAGAHRLLLLATRPEHWAYRRDGAKVGPITRYFWRTVRKAVDKYTTARNRYTKQLEDRVRALRPKLKHGLIEFRDASGKVLHVFGKNNGGFGHSELIAALLHIGNEGNLRRLLVGRGWGAYDKGSKQLDTRAWDAFLSKMVSEGYITTDVMDFVQGVWDTNEEIKPLAQAAHKELFGYRFDEVEATPVSILGKTYRGGYMPAKLDKSAPTHGRIASLEDVEADHRKQFASTGRGFTKGRVEDFAEPLLLDLMLVPSHIDQVLRFSFIQPAIRDVERLAKQRDVAAALEASQPGVWQNMLLPWLQTTASQSLNRAGKSADVDNFWRFVRSSTALSTMFANIGNTLQQITGPILAALKVPPRFLARGFWRLLTERRELFEDIAKLSPFMDNRFSHQAFDSLEQLQALTEKRGTLKSFRAWTQRHGYFLQSTMQNLVDATVWSAAYEHALSKAKPGTLDADAQAEAIAAADAAVRTTQGSFDPTDSAPYESGTPFYRLWTMFSGYFNMLGNLQADQLAKMAQATGWRGKFGVAFYAYLLGFAAPALLADGITRTVRGQWDDEDEDGDLDVLTFDYLFMSQLRGAIAEVPVAGPALIAPMVNAFDNMPWNDRMTTSPAVTVIERAFGGSAVAVKTALGLRTDRNGNLVTVDGTNVRDVLTLLGLLAGLPLGGIGARVGYGVDVASGRVTPSGTYDLVRGIASGAVGKQAERQR